MRPASESEAIAEAKYIAEEAMGDLVGALTNAYELLDGSNDVPFSQVPKHLDVAAAEVRRSLTKAAEIRSALSKIKVMETGRVG